ncbi:hypothetical protein V5O48_008146 [Marasmius crinis-equi]|uniref:Uncharacterized protein n=1 Tax=Marasmius crinis-equi TaxID=585013 RepID=A0ABR3FER5_9AGAR
MSRSQTATPTPEDEDLLDSVDVNTKLQEMSDELIAHIARQVTGLSTEDGEKVKESLSTAISKCNVVTGADGFYYLELQGKRIEFTLCVVARSTWAFNNGPDGNAVIYGWEKPGTKLPSGVSISYPEDGSMHKNYVKESRLAGMEWRVQVFEGSFKAAQNGKGGGAEWAIAGQPIQGTHDDVKNFYKCAHAKFAGYVKSDLKSVKFDDENKSAHPPGASMFPIFKRPVFVHNNGPLDEGRGSEFLDPFGVLKMIGSQADLRYNRVPEVLIRSHADKSFFPMSFHQVHEIKGGIFAVTFTPRGFQKNRPANAGGGKAFGWDFRLINMKVLGKKPPAEIGSPKKSVKVRKASDLDFEEPSAKRPNASK